MAGRQSLSLPLKNRALPPRQNLELWLINLRDMPLDAGSVVRTRKERVLQRRIRQQFVLRLLLGAYLGRPGKSVRLTRSEHGKPALAGDTAARQVAFNLSHTGDWLAIGIGSGYSIGVDIESSRRLPNAMRLARRFFPADAADWLESQDEPFLSRHFLQQWTAREALIKAVGEGLAGNLHRIGLEGHPPVVRALPEGWPGPSHWTLLEPDLPVGLVGHIAVNRPDVSVDVFELDTRTDHSQ